jgi:hypothetical protein
VGDLKAVAATGDYPHHKKIRDRALQIAYVNEAHFSAKALEAYVKWHGAALDTALRDKARPWKALHLEALALHSLTDMFAVGHMLVDRDITMAMLKEAGVLQKEATGELHQGLRQAFHGAWDFFRASDEKLQAKILYGFFANIYHNGFNHFGADVCNLRGDCWRAFGDHKYRVQEGGREVTAGQRAALSGAVTTSVAQVLRAAAGLPPPLPGTRFAALQYLPVRYRNAVTSLDPSREKTAVLEALVKENVRLASEGGIDPQLLKRKPVPDGQVGYLDALRRLCDRVCQGLPASR